MTPFADCISGGLQFSAMDPDVVPSTVRFTGGLLGAAVLDCKMAKCSYIMEHKIEHTS